MTTRTIQPQQQSPSQVRLSAVHYWQRFKRAHGVPVLHRGRCLFPDGWTHSSSDFNGPEWPPPDDQKELQGLQLAYWAIRSKQVRQALRKAQVELDALRQQQQVKSVPLQVVRQRVDKDDEGRPFLVTEIEDIDFSLIERGKGGVRELDQELGECLAKMEELKGVKA